MPQTKTIGEKIAAVLRHPLFTIPFSKPVREKRPARKKPEPPKAVKTVQQKETARRGTNRPMPVNSPYVPVTPPNAPQSRKTAPYIFTPERNKEEFEKVQFILRACNGHGGTGFTDVLHVEQTKNGSRLIGTDGKRMHVAEIGTRIKPGNYKTVVTENAVKLGKAIPNISFPNWKHVVPVNVERRGCINFDSTVMGDNGRVCGSLKRLTGERVNPQYLADLTKKLWVIYSQKEKQKALLLKEYGAERETYAVIAPLAA